MMTATTAATTGIEVINARVWEGIVDESNPSCSARGHQAPTLEGEGFAPLERARSFPLSRGVVWRSKEGR